MTAMNELINNMRQYESALKEVDYYLQKSEALTQSESSYLAQLTNEINKWENQPNDNSCRCTKCKCTK